MSVPLQPEYDGDDTLSRQPPTLRVVRSQRTPPTGQGRPADVPDGTRRGGGGKSPTAGRHAQRSVSAQACLAEAQIGISLIQLADQALSEVSVLLRRLRELAMQAASRDGQDREARQRDVFSIVEQVDLISREVRFDGSPIFDGSLAAREVFLPGGGRACLDVARLSGRTLGIESPWGRATTSRETRDTELTASTGTLPSGTFQVVGVQVFGNSGEQVATYDGTVVDFGDGVTAVFDGSLYFQEGAADSHSGVFLLDSVLSLRTRSAAEHTVTVVDRAAAMITEQRLVLDWSRSQLAQATTDVLAHRARHLEVLDAALAAEGARGLAQVMCAVPETAMAAATGAAMIDASDRAGRASVRRPGS